jgi:transcriptional regulator with XRE-family HTH domain
MSDLLGDQARRAKEWRESHGWNRAELGDLIGYSASAIANFEAGRQRNTGKRINLQNFLRYKMACAAVAAKVTFDWGPVTIRLE